MSRILIVDAEEDTRDFVAKCLAGLDVEQATSGDEALTRLRAKSFGLLIIELLVPGMSGLELLRWIHQEHPEIELIVLTTCGAVEVAVEAMKLGVFDYLQKPVRDPAKLRLLATQALERGSRQRAAGTPALSYGDPAMLPVLDAIQKVARTDTTVLLLGESGTGKEITARAIYRLSERARGPFVAINCATLSEHLLESELFGHERGAFTGATERKRGRLELADGGTFFLDEIAELKPDLQARLLRVLEERTFERVGGTRSIEVDVRWIAATHRDLQGCIEEGKFREDLYYRLCVFPVRLPALRERAGDILPLAEVLLARAAQRLRRPGGLALAEDARRTLRAARWPGNIRELANVLERAAILAEGSTIEARHLSIEPTYPARPGAPSTAMTLDQLERQVIERALEDVAGNRREAAERLGIGLRTLYQKLRRYRLDLTAPARASVRSAAGARATRPRSER